MCSTKDRAERDKQRHFRGRVTEICASKNQNAPASPPCKYWMVPYWFKSIYQNNGFLLYRLLIKWSVICKINIIVTIAYPSRVTQFEGFCILKRNWKDSDSYFYDLLTPEIWRFGFCQSNLQWAEFIPIMINKEIPG